MSLGGQRAPQALRTLKALGALEEHYIGGIEPLRVLGTQGALGNLVVVVWKTLLALDTLGALGSLRAPGEMKALEPGCAGNPGTP